jgi:signal transduction histidine kinase
MTTSFDSDDHPDFASFDAAAALDALDDACIVVSRDWRIVFANAASACLREAEREMVGAELWAAAPTLAAPAPAKLLSATMADRHRRACRLTLRHGDRGESGDRSDDPARRPEETSAIYELKVLPISGGGLCIRLRDISESVRFEQELAERIEENASLREVARILAAEVDLSALLRIICQEAMTCCGAAGTAVGEIHGDRVVIVAGAGRGTELVGVHLPLAGSLAESAVRAREVVRSDDYAVEHPYHASLITAFDTAMVMGAPLIAHDRVLGVLMIGRIAGTPPFGEREERRARAIADHAALAMWKTRLLEQVQEANRAKRDFLATISHELRTPLTALTGYEELLVDEVFGPLSEPQLNAVERMRSSTELLTLIIDEVLTFSRLEANQVTVHPHETTARAIVQDAAAVLEPLALEKHLTLTLALPDEELPLETDADMVRRILVNLGANAVKFTDQGSVTIEVAVGDDEIAFVVRDTGIGIAATDLPRLFQPFTQLETGFTRRYGGTGLGLFISQRLAGLLGGRIVVDSRLGEGSTFTLRLPLPGAPRPE